MSSVVTTGTTRAAVGYAASTGPLTTITSCPAAIAASASAAPIRPLEAFVRYRTGSRYWRVGPEVRRMRAIGLRRRLGQGLLDRGADHVGLGHPAGPFRAAAQ